MIPFPFNENRFSFFFVADHLLVGQLCTNPKSNRSLLSCLKVTRTMHQSTTPSVSHTIWPRWASRQFLTLPIVQTLLPVTFANSLSSRKNLEAVVMRQLRRWKRLWRSHKRTSMGLTKSCWNDTSALQPEENTSKGTRVSCVYYQ